MEDGTIPAHWQALPLEEKVRYLVRRLTETEAALTELIGGADLVLDPRSGQAILLRDAQEQLQQSHDELERRVAERTAELRAVNQALEREVAERRQAEEEVRRLNAVLEGRVAERTAALARANAQLHEQGERLRILHQIDQAILSARSSTEIAGVALPQLRQVLPCLAAGVLLLDENQVFTVLAFDTGGDPRVAGGSCLQQLASRELDTLRTGAAVQHADLSETDEAALRGDNGRIRACAIIPLLADNQLIGALGLGFPEAGPLAKSDLDFATQVASSLAVAIHNASLLEALQASRGQLQSLSRRLVEVQENERRAIARELHDEAGQALAVLELGLGLMERDEASTDAVRARLHELKATVDGVQQGLHRLAVTLRPASLDRVGLVPAVRQYIEFYARQTGLDVQLVADGMDGVRLPQELETALYRITQEALTNIVRHARATTAGVVLALHDGKAVAIIEDNGSGFAVATAGRERLGLLGMRERAEALGGSLIVESSPGAGTSVYVNIPYEASCQA